jgi:hypothetical protein
LAGGVGALGGLTPETRTTVLGPCASGRPHQLCRQTLPTFGTAGIDDSTACLCGHTRTETVGTFTSDGAWLECSLHGVLRPLAIRGKSRH